MNPLLGFDWRKSRPHLFLLSMFQNWQEEYRQGWFHGHDQKDWAEVLGEPLQKSIQRFLAEDMLSRSNQVADCLDFKFGLSDLKGMLKQRGLPVSGRKGELISRLVEHDIDGMRKAVAGLSVIHCSEVGQEIVEQFLSQEKQNQTNVEQQMMQALSGHRFKEAVQVFYRFESREVFPRSLSLSNQSPTALRKWWENRDPSKEITILQLIFTRTPKVLAKSNNEELASARVAAGMFELWEVQKYLEFSDTLQSETDYSPKDIAFALWRHAYYCRNLTDYQRRGVKFVGVDAFNDACEACKKIARKRYKLDEVPELPYEHCESPSGCRCGLSVE